MRAIVYTVFLFLALASQAQNKYWVYLADKDTSGFNPYAFFDTKAIERRVVNGLSLYDYNDIPVKVEYVETIRSIADSVTYASRWFNAVCLYASDEQMVQIVALPFVSGIEEVRLGHFTVADTIINDVEDEEGGLRGLQLSLMQADRFAGAGITGKGIRVAIFDGGFPNVDKLPCFQHIRDNNRIIKTWDFTRNKENVYGFSSHGTTVMCCIAGMDPDGTRYGMATDAEFLLARTEVNAEPFSEEENWVAALEWADQNGADIVNSSLGYTYQRYFPYEMDGKTSFVTRGANMAASKGILVVNAAGNEGDKKSWKIIGAPADADSILSVGGVDPYSGYHINFSSFGPTADGRMKPNVCAAGHVYAYGKSGRGEHYGTSFASPLTAGFVACAMQAKPGVKAYDMFLEIQKSGHLYPYFDYAHGYGIPQASYFTGDAIPASKAEITWGIDTTDELVVTIRQDSASYDFYNYCFIHLADADGKLLWYSVVSVYDPVSEVLRMVPAFTAGQILRIHYLDQNKEIKFPY